MLKIALPTFKNDENHTQNSKIHIQNSGCVVRCGECGGDFLYFSCQGGENMVRLRRLVVWLRGFRVWFLYDLVADAAFGNL